MKGGGVPTLKADRKLNNMDRRNGKEMINDRKKGYGFG